jgi:hypothetical protein
VITGIPAAIAYLAQTTLANAQRIFTALTEYEKALDSENGARIKAQTFECIPRKRSSPGDNKQARPTPNKVWHRGGANDRGGGCSARPNRFALAISAII